MIVDSSVLVAIVLGEPQAELFVQKLCAQPTQVSAVSVVETSIVVESRQGPDATRDLDLLLHGSRLKIISVDSGQAILAFAAWRRFGKSRHPAALNLRNCFSYALAKSTGLPLLFQGADFSQTDIAAA